MRKVVLSKMVSTDGYFEGPKNLFNAGLDNKNQRLIHIHQGDKPDKLALKDLIRAAVAHSNS